MNKSICGDFGFLFNEQNVNLQLNDELKYIKYDDTVRFTVPINYGKVVKVYDGDTITLASKLPYKNSPIYRFQVRLNGIDSPEIRGKTDTERKKAIEAKESLSFLIMDKFVRLDNVSTEKYGRILADVYYRDVNVNEWMISHNFAVKYDGGTKIKPAEWDE